MKDLLHSLLTKLRAFRAARNGNVTLTFALATLPMIGFVGAAVDYSHANSVRAAIQAAVDSTALMLSKEVANLTTAQLNTKAFNYFMAMFNRPEATNIVVTPSYTTANGSQMVITASANVPTNFMGVMGFDHLSVSASSTAKWGNIKLRVALALDNTGSMSSSNKMTALKTAAKTLIDQLKSSATATGDVYVSIVPFAKDVNVGSGNYNSNWVDFDDHGSWQGWKSTNGSCSKKDSRGWPINNKADCSDARGTWTADTPSASNWGGCVTDRDQDYDADATAPDITKKNTLYPAEKYNDCPKALMPLSYDWTALKSKIDSMQPAGNTNVTIGLAWAWQTLTINSPFPAPAEDPKYNYQKVIILLTDGDNTQNRFSSSQSSIDARTKKACDNIKAVKNPDGTPTYLIYTIRVIDGNASLLQNCATKPEMYYNVDQAVQLSSVFSSIGTALSHLRLSK